jgi:hypothetical protein
MRLYTSAPIVGAPTVREATPNATLAAARRLTRRRTSTLYATAPALSPLPDTLEILHRSVLA